MRRFLKKIGKKARKAARTVGTQGELAVKDLRKALLIASQATETAAKKLAKRMKKKTEDNKKAKKKSRKKRL